jgi:hypothetical protein
MNITKAALVGMLVVVTGARAGDFALESAGLRAGVSYHCPEDRFLQTEGFTKWSLPWSWDLGAKWTLRPQLDLSAGWLSGRGNDGFVGTIGPTLRLSRDGLPLALTAGISPTILSDTEYGSKDFGFPLQFTSHVGLEWQPHAHIDVGYRFQHMSNAGLGEQNPGLNLHMFTIGYVF